MARKSSKSASKTSSPREIDWYDTPLYYDIIFDEGTLDEADFMEAMLELHGRSRRRGPGRILEPACGSGRMLKEMAWRGYEVVGFDLNENSLRFAGERMRKARLEAGLLLASMQDFRVGGRFDLAHCMVSTFKYLLTEEDALANLRCVARALKPGGLYLLGLHLTDYDRTKVEHERWTGERDGLKVTCNTRTYPANRRTRLEPLRTRLKIEQASGEVSTQETHWQFRTYDARQLKLLIDKVPEFERVAQYDFSYDLAVERDLGDPMEDVLVILRKR